MYAHLASQLWHRVLSHCVHVFLATPNTSLPNNLPDHQNSKRFLSSSLNIIAAVEIQHINSAVQILVIEKELTGVWSENGSSTKIYHSDICRDCLVFFFLQNRTTKWIWGASVHLCTLPSLHLVSYYGLKIISSSNHHFIHLAFVGPLLPPTVNQQKAPRLSFIVLPVVQASMYRYKSSSVLINS